MVEYAFVVRVNPAMTEAERLLPDGSWVEYDDLWDVTTNGRYIDTEEEALRHARDLFERDAAWEAERGERAAPEAEPERAAPEAEADPEAEALEHLLDGLQARLERDPEEREYEHERLGRVSVGLRLEREHEQLLLDLTARLGKGSSWVRISAGGRPELEADLRRYRAEIGLLQQTLAGLLRNLVELDR
jgi:hypothetical protein